MAGETTSDDGIPVAPLHLLAQLVRILEIPSKGQVHSEMCEAQESCRVLLQRCPNCGVREHWNPGLRKLSPK